MPLLALLLAAGDVPAQTSFTGLGSLPGAQPGSEAHDLSGDGGVVVGGCPGAASCSEAWRWTGSGGLQGLGFLAGESGSVATATNADGSIVFGVSGTPFRWTSGTMTDIGAGLPAFDQIHVRGSSADGLVAVGGFVSTTTLQGGAYRWTPGGGIEVLEPFTIPHLIAFRDVSADGAVIAGAEGAPDDPLAFVRTEAGKDFLPELPNDPVCQCGSEALAISDDALTVVGVSHAKPFRWTATAGTLGLGSLPGSSGGAALGVSADGAVIVGTLFGGSGSDAAFVWTAAGGIRDLREALEDGGLDLTGWTLDEAVAVSSNGSVIAGNGTNPSGAPEAWRAVLPRPPAVPALPLAALWTLAGLLVASGAAARLVLRTS